MDAVIDKRLLAGLQNKTWFFTGAESPPLIEAKGAVDAYLANRELGPDGRLLNAQEEANCKQRVAQLVNGSADNIALLSNSSEIISLISNSLELRPGDNVVINTIEFPSGILPWIALKQKGIEIRVIDHANWEISVEDILAQVDEKTRVVMTSHVSYLTGARLDYIRLYEQLKQTNALLFLDVTQALGVVKVDINHTDLLVCSSYKWLMSIHGLGILGINPKRVTGLTPKAVGWRSVTNMFGVAESQSFTFWNDASRFEQGYPSYATIYALSSSAKLLLETGIERIERHVLELGQYLIEQMAGLPYPLMTPEAAERRAGNICFECAAGEEIAEALKEKSIYIWGGDGRFRASIHLFNDKEDVDRLVSQLKQLNI
ncbi:aminotransferase class V-fold PLP-dependent enzyme [Paenibacillus sp. GXUN7292]|uniref:aminotransferase class V-fold PLP-dependent enzyme n=1 Tax=Paenibacillus sp. GXUN7292 TaxID=3422499 RepID=UPI003D7E7CB4